MTRALASHQCDPGSIPAPCRMWVGFVVGSRFAPRVFLPADFPIFLPRKIKTNISKFQLGQDKGAACKPGKADVASSPDIVIHSFIYLVI